MVDGKLVAIPQEVVATPSFSSASIIVLSAAPLATFSTLASVFSIGLVKAANMVDGKLVAIPQEVVAYGLFVNKDMFDEYHLFGTVQPGQILQFSLFP